VRSVGKREVRKGREYASEDDTDVVPWRKDKSDARVTRKEEMEFGRLRIA
jgi:hypothetical protein